MKKQIGLTIMRCQPPHKGHVELIDSLREITDKVYVFITGNKVKTVNPFSYETRVNILTASLSTKNKSPVEFIKVENRPGHIPSLIKDFVKEKNVEYIFSIGSDRIDKFSEQLSDYEHDILNDISIIPHEYVVDNNSKQRINGTYIRELIVKDEKEKVKRLLSSNIKSKQFDTFYKQLRYELSKIKVLHGDNVEQLKSIPHLKDLNNDEFNNWLVKILYYLGKNQGLEISEKIDGTLQCSFGVQDDKFYISPKSNVLYFSEDGCKYDSQRTVFKLLKKFENQIKENFSIELSKDEIVYPQFFIEVLQSPIPNVIEYENNMLVFYKVSANGFPVKYEKEREIITSFLKLIPSSRQVNSETWYFVDKPIIKASDIEAQKRFVLISMLTTMFVLKDNIDVKNDVYEILKLQLGVDEKSLLGGNNSFMEGVVIKDTVSGEMVKIQNEEMFRTTQDYLWHWRHLLGKGYTPYKSTKFIPGIEFNLYKNLSALFKFKLLFSKHLALSAVKKFIQNEDSTSYKSKNTFIDAMLLKYIYQNDLFSDYKTTDDGIELFSLYYQIALNDVIKLNEEWTAFKNSEDKFIEIKNRKIEFDQYNEEKTDREFIDKLTEYADIIRKIDKVDKSKLHSNLKLVSLLKLSLGKENLLKQLK